MTVVCDHFTGKVIWAAKGRSKETVGKFFDALGAERAGALRFVTADGAEWIRLVVVDRAPDAIVCIDTFHVVGWATTALDEVRRQEWNRLRASGGATAAKALKGLRWLLLLRNWENLSGKQKGVIRSLDIPGGGFHLELYEGRLTDKRNSATSSRCHCSPPAELSTTGWRTRPDRSSPRS